jgi:polyketide cyclase/dehydrase/lipid transport protein
MMKSLITALLVSSSLILVSEVADAANLASGKKLEVKVDPKKIGEETTALWQRFGGWCAIAEWQPAVKKCEETKEGSNVFRTLTLGDGGKIKEKLLNKTPTSYRYAIVESPLPVKNYEAQFSVVPDDDHADEVNIVWAATYDAADGKNEKDARSLIDGSFKDGIASIKAKLGDKASGKPATLDCARYMPTAGITVAVPCDQ